MRQANEGRVRAEIAEALMKFEKEYMGRGPLEGRTYLVDDLVIVRLKGVLTHAELKLVESAEPAKGRDLIKSLRTELVETGRPLLSATIGAITGRQVGSMHTDISTITGERVVIFTLLNETA